MKDQRREVGVPQLIWGVIKLAFFAAILATPLAGAWISSSLAAYLNGSPRLCVLTACLLFPILPLLWEGIASARAKKPRTSRFVDRIILRTLSLNVVFLGVLLWRFPAQAYVATSTRGDWFLEGRSGVAVDVLRTIAFQSARGLKWIDEAAQPNPYKKQREDEKPVVPQPVPVPERKKETGQTPQQPIAATALWPQASELHHAVREIPASDETSIESVALYLRAHSDGPADRLKAMHDWIADRIAYDAPALLLPEVPQEDAEPEAVFARRKAVCAGYARLFRAMAAVTGDQVEYVEGDARVTTSADPAPGGHAWNAVFVNGGWQLVDVTWDAGYVNDPKEGFQKRYTSDWLFTPPEVFGLRHQPSDARWQLREQPIDEGTFLRQPMLEPSFYRRHLTMTAPDRAQVTVSGVFEASITAPNDVDVLATYAPHGGGASGRCTVAGSGALTITCTMPRGQYDVTVFAGSKSATKYGSVGEFAVNVSS